MRKPADSSRLASPYGPRMPLAIIRQPAPPAATSSSMAAAQRDLIVLDEKRYLQVFAAPATQHLRRPAAGGGADLHDDTEPFVFPELPDLAIAALHRFLEDLSTAFENRYFAQQHRVAVRGDRRGFETCGRRPRGCNAKRVRTRSLAPGSRPARSTSAPTGSAARRRPRRARGACAPPAAGRPARARPGTARRGVWMHRAPPLSR